MDAERLSVFLEAYDRVPDREDIPAGTLLALRQRAEDEDVPVIRREMENLLKVLLTLRKPSRILEIGTGSGYSASVMAAACGPRTQITTIENYPPRIEAAKKTFSEGLWSDQITLIEGDGTQVLKSLTGSFDFIFLDAAKGQYPAMLPDIVRLSADGTLLTADNVLLGGTILNSRYAVERRDRTIHERMREYLYAVRHTDGITTCIVPVGDGAALSVIENQETAMESLSGRERKGEQTTDA